MLTLDGTQLPLKSLRISIRQQLAGQDMSGQTSSTDSAETGSKGKVLTVSGVIPFSNPKVLTDIFAMADTKNNGARHIFRISNRTAEALKIRQVKFQGSIRADEQTNLRQWNVTFDLVEHLSVPERKEQRQPEKPAAQQKAQGATTQKPPTQPAQDDVPPDTEPEATGVLAFLKKVDDSLA
ncbi:baseplate complex protein [Photobacterium leiognathi]|uniref:baseplate complex protein n=1 Tax=Photobacterium leiognathi TaxID=553611 RepID=UPI0029816A26|nr:adenine glycosylase [Photobacterium leiognathi]